MTAAAEPSVQAAIYGCSGPELTAWEVGFFRDAAPYGLILFARNCQTPDQVRRLIAQFRDAVGRPAPVLIDQEGGRVQRLKPPVWPKHLPAAAVGAGLAAGDSDRAVTAWAAAIAAEVAALQISHNATPVADLISPATHDSIGDRAYGSDPAVVVQRAGLVCDAMLAAGVMPIVKHLPGYGRATVDSHASLPVVTASREVLEATDFAVFRARAARPWGMTAHVVYTAIDPETPGTLSPIVIDQVIRGFIGFDGVLVTDDLSMGALSGPVGSRAARALAAGCDLALHCNGDRGEMRAVADAVRAIDPAGHRRLAHADAVMAAAVDGPPAVS